jgi:thioredoxin-related protein
MNDPRPIPLSARRESATPRPRTVGILLGLAVALIVGIPLSAEENPWLQDLDAALGRANATKRMVLLDIYAPWCGYCRKLQRDVYPSAEVRKESAKFVLVRINGEEHPRVMRQYGVRGFPTVILLDSGGKEMDRIDGYMPSRAFARKLRDVERRQGRGNDILQQLEGDPSNVLLNFRAGVYYYEAGDMVSARRYFLRAYRGDSAPNGAGGAEENERAQAKRRDALYNVAIASMELGEHGTALTYWNRYIKEYPHNDRDHSYARYYRGQSLYELGQNAQARSDFEFASRYLPDDDDRASAARMLAAIP